jgi:NADPH-dependent 2,4-dienoyl-CoA reductase/sulfur reductase-like enzyme/rhodanese-related sulfurtransferase
MSRKILVVGGVAAGASAAVKARRTDENAAIVVFEKGPYVSYANCGIPYYLSGEIADREDLFLVTPERFAKRFNIDVRTRHEVVGIDPQAHTITALDLVQNRRYQEPYDRLILATGNEPAQLKVQDNTPDGVFSMWTVPDADAIQKYMAEHHPTNAVVVGAGFVGLETTEALLTRGLKVTLVEVRPQVLPQMDHGMTEPLVTHLRRKKADVILGDGVISYEDDGQGRIQAVLLKSGRRIECGLVITAVGVRQRIALAREVGLKIGAAGGIVVDDHMRTSVADIYAAGDIVETIHLVTGESVKMPLAGPANKQGRVAGANAAGGNLSFPGVLGTMIVRVCDLTAAKTGLSESEARAAGFDPLVSYTHSSDHAAYYPGAETMMIKIVADRNDGRLLGAQIVGPKGVDKRIDVFATALMGRMKVTDLESLDLAYAPPFGSAKDPAVIAGMVAANIFRKEMAVITPEEFADRLQDEVNLQIVDVRTPEEYNAGHIAGAINIPLDELRARYQELDSSWDTVIYCGIAYRAYLAYQILSQKGFRKLRNLSGGWRSWTMTLPR